MGVVNLRGDMPLYIVALTIHVRVDAPNERIAERIAFEQGHTLRKGEFVVVTSGQTIRKVEP